MRLLTLVLSEIRHRWINFLLTALCVAVAVGALVSSLTLLKADELNTNGLLAARTAEVEKAGKALEDAARKIQKGLGFNILILPEDQDLAVFQAEDAPTTSMPEKYVDQLANSKIVSINHLLPIITKKIEWPEMKRTAVITGTRGEVPLMHRALKKPLQDVVPEGTMIVGSLFAQAGQSDAPTVAVGDKVKLMGREFEITKIHPERGTSDDITAWINLGEAQELFGMQNLVNAILALECNCSAPDRIGQIRQEIAEILPGTQVLEQGKKALARAEMRTRAASLAEENLEQAKLHRDNVMAQRSELTSILVPLVVGIAATWIALLTLLNVRQRREEIGILRAIGLGAGQILQVLLGKSVLAGLVGGAVGVVAGFVVGSRLSELGDTPATQQLWQTGWFAAAFLAAPVLSMLAGCVPALMAAKADPAIVLADS